MVPENSAAVGLGTIRAVAIDVDGVLSDGGLWWGPSGEEWKRFCFADIMGVSLARRAGLILALNLWRKQRVSGPLRREDAHTSCRQGVP